MRLSRGSSLGMKGRKENCAKQAATKRLCTSISPDAKQKTGSKPNIGNPAQY
jgi:hypothetical protein